MPLLHWVKLTLSEKHEGFSIISIHFSILKF